MERSVTTTDKPNQAVATPTPTPQQRKSLMTTFAAKYGVEPAKLYETLKDTAFKQPFKDGKPGPVPTDAQMLALLAVANEYNLNPFLKQIYAFAAQGGGIVPMVPIDGWIRIINSHPAFKSMELKYPPDDAPREDYYVECIIERSDRDKPTVIREYLSECWRDTGPWKSHPRRMTRHKAISQCGRVAFGFGGIYDPDEGERVANAMAIDAVATPSTKPPTQAPRARQLSQEPEQSAAAQGPVETSADGKVTTAQLQQIRYLLDQTGIPENETAEQFGVEILEDLAFGRVPEVLAWVDRVGKGG